MLQLRELLKTTIALQARFAALRLEQALPKMLAAASSTERERVKANFYNVAGERLGLYALMDYVNFKGEGVNPTERYRGQGWGLLQVLEAMPGPALRCPASPRLRIKCSLAVLPIRRLRATSPNGCLAGETGCRRIWIDRRSGMEMIVTRHPETDWSVFRGNSL